MKIDYVFPYVNSSDIIWQKSASKYISSKEFSKERFRELGFLRYVFRGLAENMPWLNQIIILVSSISQVPKWLFTLNPKIRVVLHKDFIPEEYLPTFNSTTIEMFLHNIPDLSEYFIYSNDDLYPLAPSNPEDYFTDEGIPKVSYEVFNETSSLFRKQCKRIWDLVTECIPDSKLEEGHFYKQCHEVQPMTLSLLKEVTSIFQKEILDSITRKRDLKKNLSQYLYIDYAIASGKCEKREKYHSYKQLQKSSKKAIISIIKSKIYKWICINDTEKTDRSVINDIQDAFEKRFPHRCIYEKSTAPILYHKPTVSIKSKTKRI